jgi:hypothetical protein
MGHSSSVIDRLSMASLERCVALDLRSVLPLDIILCRSSVSKPKHKVFIFSCPLDPLNREVMINHLTIFYVLGIKEKDL